MFKVTYTDFKIAHLVGDLPQLKLCFTLETTVERNWRIYIPDLQWEVGLSSTEGPDYPSKGVEGDWGIFHSPGPAKLLGVCVAEQVFCTIPISTPKIQQLVNIRSQGKMPRLEIRVRLHYLNFKLVDNLYQLESVIPFDVRAQMLFKGREVEHVTFGTDEIVKLLEEITQYEIARVEILVRKEGKPINKLLAEVVDILDRAKKDFIEGNYDGVLKGVRDALQNRILEWNPEKKQWMLNRNIEKDFLDNAPIKTQEEYTELLKWIGKQFHSQLRIINDVYMHRNKVTITPRPQEAEEILWITAFLVRYLSLTCVTTDSR